MKLLSVYSLIFSVVISFFTINAAIVHNAKMEKSEIDNRAKEELFDEDQTEHNRILKADHIDYYLIGKNLTDYYGGNYSDNNEEFLLQDWEEIETLFDAHYQELKNRSSSPEASGDDDEDEDDDGDSDQSSSEDESDDDSDDLNYNYSSSCDDYDQEEDFSPHKKCRSRLIKIKATQIKAKETFDESDDDPRSYKCNVKGCGRAFIYKNNFELHKLEHYLKKNQKKEEYSKNNLGSRIYKCPYRGCKKTFKGHTGLLYHKRKHENDLRYPCSLCKKRCMQKKALEIHMRTHTGEKPFICSVCERSFSEKANRDRHEILIHSKGKNER